MKYSSLVCSIVLIPLILACSDNGKQEVADSHEEIEVQQIERGELPVFKNVIHERGIGDVSYLGQTASWADFNNNGHLDLLMGNTDLRFKTLFFFRNDEGNFAEIIEEVGIHEEPVRSSAWADFDNDGYIDVLIGTIRAASPPILYRNVNGERFENVNEQVGLNVRGGTVRHSLWGDYNLNGFVDILQINTGRNFLYRNNGDGTFTEVSIEAGLTAEENSDSAVFFDSNNNGLPDIFIANSGPNRFYVNNGDGTFTDKSEESGLSTGERWGTSAVCSGDYNNNGYIDIYISNISSSRNALYRNNGDGTFTDVTDEAGVRDVGDGRTCIWIDIDNNGYLDLFTTNHTVDNKLYKNMGDGTFVDIAEKLGVNKPVDVFAVSAGDYNNNSLPDLILTGHLGKALFENSGTINTSLIVELIGNGTTTNRSAINSKVWIKTSMGKQVREVSGGRGCCEQDMLPVHFGLGQENTADITVNWTDGTKCEFNDVEINRDKTLKIEQEDCVMSIKH